MRASPPWRRLSDLRRVQLGLLDLVLTTGLLDLVLTTDLLDLVLTTDLLDMVLTTDLLDLVLTTDLLDLVLTTDLLTVSVIGGGSGWVWLLDLVFIPYLLWPGRLIQMVHQVDH